MIKKFFAVLLLIAPLSGCITTAAVTAATTTVKVATDPRSVSTLLTDKHITQTTNNLFQADKKLKDHANVEAISYDQNLLLLGQVQTPVLRKRAYDIATYVKSVKHIYNQITISGSISTLQKMNDGLLTSKVDLALLFKSGVDSNDIKVITENSVAYLMGKVSPAQAQLAANVARTVPGVTKVVKVFQYERS